MYINCLANNIKKKRKENNYKEPLKYLLAKFTIYNYLGKINNC
jgi:hypothetical protein